MWNAVEPGDEKSRAKTTDGKKKKRFPEKLFFYISSFFLPQNLAKCPDEK